MRDVLRRFPQHKQHRKEAAKACLKAADRFRTGSKSGSGKYPPRCLSYVRVAQSIDPAVTGAENMKILCRLGEAGWRLNDARRLRIMAMHRQPEYRYRLWKRLVRLMNSSIKQINDIKQAGSLAEAKLMLAHSHAYHALAQLSLARYRGENRRQRLNSARQSMKRAIALAPADALVLEIDGILTRRLWGRGLLMGGIVVVGVLVLLLLYMWRRRRQRIRLEQLTDQMSDR